MAPMATFTSTAPTSPISAAASLAILILTTLRAFATALILLILLGLSAMASAQSEQSADPELELALKRLPDRARTGKLAMLTIDVFPQAKLDGKDVYLAPGARVFSTTNLIVLPMSIQNAPQPVVYRQDVMGQLLEAWVLTDDEIRALKKFQKNR
jgi:hypothetical protein